MTNRIRREVAPGIEFAVESTGFAGSGTIILPAEYVELLPVKTLHNALLQMVPLAKLVNIDFFASYIIDRSVDGLIDNRILDEEKDNIDELLKYQGQTADIEKAIDIVEETQQRNSNRSTLKAKRLEIASSYNEIFMNLGRRDGFCCAYCSVSRDLVIDHIVALINGGGNDMNNLQLLCRTCNAKKSDK